MRHELVQAKRRVKRAVEGPSLVERTRVGKANVGYESKCTGALCLVLAGTNAVPVSSEWGKTVMCRDRIVTAEAAEIRGDQQILGAQLRLRKLGEKWMKQGVSHATSANGEKRDQTSPTARETRVLWRHGGEKTGGRRSLTKTVYCVA